MITINFNGSTFAYDMLGDFEYYYQQVDPEILPLLKQLDFKYEPDDKAKSRDKEVYESSLVSVTIRGNAKVIDQLADSLRGRDDFFFFWTDRDPWFLSKYVHLGDMGEDEAKFLLEKYIDAIPEYLRADFSALLAG